MAWQDQINAWKNDGTTLKSSGAVTVSGTAETAVEVGKGDFTVEIDVTAITQGTGSDHALIVVEANTAAATTTWAEIGNLSLGDAGGTGRAVAIGVDTYTIGVKNQGDYQVRIKTYLVGSTSSVTFSAVAYPNATKNASI